MAEFIQVTSESMGAAIQISPELLRRCKQDDEQAAAPMRRLMCELIGALEGFKMKEAAPDSACLDVINLYLSLNKNPFVMVIDEEAFVDLSSSRELLKILCWLLFSNKKLLSVLDREFVRSFCEIRIDQLSKGSKSDADARKTTPERSKLQQIEDMNELIQLKTILFLKLDTINSLRESHSKKLGKVLSSLHNYVTQKSGTEGVLSNMPPSSLLSLLANKKSVDSLINSQSVAQKMIDHIGQRSVALEWMAHSVAEEKAAKSQQVSALDYPEAAFVAQQCHSAKVVELQDIYNTVSKQLEALASVADQVSKFGDFWASQCQRMTSNPDYKKVIGSIVNRETNRLANKYKKRKEESVPLESAEDFKQVDLFKVLIDMRFSGKHAMVETKLAKGRGEANAQQVIQKVADEYIEFVSEVKEYLLSRGIKTIHYPS